jgi:hypothetical protein
MDFKQKQKQINLTLQIILWLWFGLITSFVSVNVVNIARLETQMKHSNEVLLRHLTSCKSNNC